MFIQSGELVIISRIKAVLYNVLNSLRMRLFFILLLVGLLPIFILKHGILSNYETQSVQQRTELIRSRSEMIARDVASSGYLTKAATPEVDKELEQLGNLWGGRVVLLDSTFQIVRDTYNIDTGKVMIADQILRSYKDGQGGNGNYNKQYEFLEVVVLVQDGSSDGIQGMMIISVPTNDIENGKIQLSHTVVVLQTFLILGVLFSALYASALMVNPFRKVTNSLKQNASSPDAEISIPGFTETQLLADAYNEMRHRMEAQEQARQEFVSNVSHELKTPLTSMKVLADSLLSQPEVPNELYQEFMQDMSEEIDRENKIITDLLSLVKMDRRSSDLEVKETNINDLIDLILKRLRPIAAKSNVELVLENYKPILAEVDETKLTLAISNLVENAIKYNKPEGGWVHVSLNMDGVYCYVKVEDSGIGIPKDQQQFIFERFYRVDKSHSKEIGGTGLGLAITRSVVRMHHGELRVHSQEGVGTTFNLRFPLRYVKETQQAGGQHE